MPKKQKKPLNKKPLKKSKLKNVVNVKINIDNSKKTTGRRVAATNKAPTQQSFANFPSYQPTRIQQLEPKQQFNNADLTKTIDEIYQKQFKIYMDAQDKELKKWIDENDDSLKKDLAPSQKDSAPGAFNVYADNKGKVVSEGPVPKNTWINPNEFKQNTMLETDAEPFGINRLFEEDTQGNILEIVAEAKGADIDEMIRGGTQEERDKAKTSLENVKREQSILKKYEEYKAAWRQYYKNNEYQEQHASVSAAGWGKKASDLIKKIEEYGTYEDEQQIKKLNKQLTIKAKKQNQSTIV